MSRQPRWRVLRLVPGLLALSPAPGQAADGDPGPSLARCIPAEAGLFLEFRDVPGLSKTPGGASAAGALARLLTSPPPLPGSQPSGAPATTQAAGGSATSQPVSDAPSSQPVSASPTSQPASAPPSSQPVSDAPSSQPGVGLAGTQPAAPRRSLREVVAGAIGLPAGAAAKILFDGRLAVAADGWDRLGSAVLLADPTDPAALEAVLAACRVPESADRKVRRYRLAQEHELACDGRSVVVGRPARPSGLYARTVAFWESRQGVPLADLAEYRERVAALPPGSQLVFYAGSTGQSASRPAVAADWWPQHWPRPQSAAVGVVVSDTSVAVEVSGRLASAQQAPKRSDLPPDILSRVPASTIVAWTQPVDFVGEFRQVSGAHTDGPLRFLIDSLQAGLAEGAVEQQLLAHLVGHSIFMVGSAGVPPAGDKDAGVPLLLPAMVLAVETDDPHSVEVTLQHLAGNLLALLNVGTAAEERMAIQEEPLEPGGGTLRCIAPGRLFAGLTGQEFLRSVEISWTVADRWLVIGTHRERVREVVRARRRQVATMPADTVETAAQQVKQSGGWGELVLVAQPREASAMIDSWFAFVSRHHPELLDPRWWERLRRQQMASGAQLGFTWVPSEAGTVQVDQTWPNWPAHGRLQSGDRIVAVDGRGLDPKRTMASLRELVAMRERPGVVTLKVVRAGAEQTIDVPMPAEAPPGQVDPVELLRQIADLLRGFSSASYAAWRQGTDLVEARLELQFARVPTTSP